MFKKNKPAVPYLEDSGYKNGPMRRLAGLGIGMMLTMSQSAMATHDDFDVVRVFIDMEEKAVTLPVPDYGFVDILGDFKNAEDSIACGGTVSEGTAEDADDCLIMPQLEFENGYLKTNGSVITPNAATYNGKVANTEVVGYVGDIVELMVNNKLPDDLDGDGIADSTGFFAPASNLQSVHWHGMELDNESDGTPITETAIETGNSRLYRFRLYRPGPFWFHPHILPLLTESRGMVGRLIVKSKEEDTLKNIGVLPLKYRALTLTDMTVANETNQVVFNLGELFDHFTDFEVANNLLPNIAPDLDDDGECDRGAQAHDCLVNEGELVLVNGKVPTSDANIETIYVREGGGARIAFINSSNERFYRFRLLLEGEEPPSLSAADPFTGLSGQCYADGSMEQFSGQDPLSCDQGLPLYRVGGEGGLLDHVRVEGINEIGPGEEAPAFDPIIRKGEDFIGPAERTEFVVVTKDRNGNYLEPGDSMYVWMIDYPHGIHQRKFDNNIGNGEIRNRDKNARKLVRIKVVPNPYWWLPDYDIAEGAPLLAHPAVNKLTENLKVAAANNLSAVPVGVDSVGNPFAGTTDPGIKLDNRVAEDGTRVPTINNNRGEYSGLGGIIGDYLPTQDSTRYARIGDVIEFAYANQTFSAHHPFHMHGFSFQPISIHTFSTVDTDGDGTADSPVLDEEPLYTYDYNEFVDVIAMQPNRAVKFRMKMNDRFKIPDAAILNEYQLKLLYPYDDDQPYGGSGDIENPFAQMGGGLGRWLFHCHILHHAGLGMIGDLCIAPENDPDASGCKIDIDENVSFPTPWWW